MVFTGVATNVCVETTTREGSMRDYYVVFSSDSAATCSDADHEATLQNIDRYFGQVVPVGDLDGQRIVRAWPGSGRQCAPSNRSAGPGKSARASEIGKPP